MSCPEGGQHNNRPWHERTEPLMIIEAARNAHPLSIVDNCVCDTIEKEGG